MVYMGAPEHLVAAGIAGEFLDAGVERARIRVVSASPEKAAAMPAAVVRYRSPMA